MNSRSAANRAAGQGGGGLLKKQNEGRRASLAPSAGSLMNVPKFGKGVSF